MHNYILNICIWIITKITHNEYTFSQSRMNGRLIKIETYNREIDTILTEVNKLITLERYNDALSLLEPIEHFNIPDVIHSVTLIRFLKDDEF